MPEIVAKFEGQQAAEAGVASFRKDLAPFVVAAETTRMAMLFTDAKLPETQRKALGRFLVKAD